MIDNLKCNKCLKVFKHKGNYTRHINRVIPCVDNIENNIDDNKTYNDNYNENKYKKNNEKNNENNNENNNDNNIKYICDYCDDIFKSENDLISHYEICKHKQSIDKIKKIEKLIKNNKTEYKETDKSIIKINKLVDLLNKEYNTQRLNDNIIFNKQKLLFNNAINRLDKKLLKIEYDIEQKYNNNNIYENKLNIIENNTKLLKYDINNEKNEINKLNNIIKNQINKISKLENYIIFLLLLFILVCIIKIKK